MTPEAQRIAIAEACGWREVGKVGVFTASYHPCGFHPTRPRGKERLPDYLNDLNAMHEAENGLTDGQIPDWKASLRAIVTRDANEWLDNLTERATAAQRAEAFLRVIEKWEDSK